MGLPAALRYHSGFILDSRKHPMKTSRFHLVTRKETPADAEIVSHQLMIRAGLINKLGSGLYTWTPLGLKVLRKVENIVREEMDRTGALEVLMPAVQPAELWQETGRWEEFGGQLLKIRDRAGRDYCFGPTHEEVITDFARKEIKSYKQLPINFYQIQTKFRDEIRPRFGVMRAREFIMKDAYSFHIDEDSLKQTYQAMHDAYCRIFERIGLHYRAVDADSGAIGGSGSQEFHVIADSGEDAIAYSDSGDYAANIEKAEALPPAEPRPAPSEAMQVVDTPNARTIDEVSAALGLPKERIAKTLLVEGEDGPVALVLRGDHELNEIKADHLPAVKSPLRFLSPEEVQQVAGCEPGSVGVKGLKAHVIADPSAANLADFVTGANREGQHLTGVNWERDAHFDETADIRNVTEGDPSPDGKGHLKFARGIEVGHIFQLGDKYSKAMNAVVLGEDGKSVPMKMGCYGIGVSRIVGAAIEQNHDDKGIVWPAAIAPFQVAILPMNMHKSERVRATAEKLHEELQRAGVEVLLDDRKIRPGAMFADAELLGIPWHVVIGDRSLDQGEVEVKSRKTLQSENMPLDSVVSFLLQQTTTEQ